MVNRKKVRRVPKKIVEWIDKTGCKPAPFAREIPVYRHGETDQSMFPDLIVGDLYVTLCPFGTKYFDDPNVGFLVREYLWGNPEIPVGSFLIYAGTKRVDERASASKIVSVIKHVFIVNGGMYVVNNPNEVKQVV